MKLQWQHDLAEATDCLVRDKEKVRGVLLASVMSGDVRVTGVEREPSWVEQARARAASLGLAGRFSYQLGEAERLPFPDDSFDLTTCQTVLIHLRDPAAAIAEMRRVTRPGGLVAVAEPNNLADALGLDSISNQAGVDEVMDLVRFQLTCERGKVALGEGDNSLGNRVPGLFVAQGLVEVDARVNDRATPVFPPYATAAQRAFVEEERDRLARRVWIWTEADTQRYFLASGGSESDFAAQFARALASRERIVRGVDDGTYHGISGGAFFLVSGRKSRGRV